MIKIKFNDQLIVVETSLNLSDFLTKYVPEKGYYAVALNRKFISKSNYITCWLQTDDHIELITPMQGG